jgi:hypothetical protein
MLPFPGGEDAGSRAEQLRVVIVARVVITAGLVVVTAGLFAVTTVCLFPLAVSFYDFIKVSLIPHDAEHVIDIIVLVAVNAVAFRERLFLRVVRSDDLLVPRVGLVLLGLPVLGLYAFL